MRPFELPLLVDMRSSKNQLLTDVQDALDNRDPRGRCEKVDGPLQAAPGREHEPCRDHDDSFGARAEPHIAAQAERLRLRADVRHKEGARDCGDREHDRDVVAFTREHERDYSGAALNVFSGQAVYVGPTLYARLGRKAFVSAAWGIQIHGRAITAPGALDLVNFERHQAKLRFGVEF